MPRATAKLGSFSAVDHLLDNGSVVSNLRIWTHQGIWIDIAEMPSHATAGACADMLTRVLHQFAACRSDREVISLAIAIEDTLKKELTS